LHQSIFGRVIRITEQNKTMKHIKLFEEFTANRVTCDNCDWSWEIEDGGDDVFICHKCGHDNSPILGESK